MKEKVESLLILPLVTLRGMVLFPNTSLYFEAGKEYTINAIEESMLHEELIFVTSQINILSEEVNEENICLIGVVSKIKQAIKLPNGNLRVVVEGICRGRINKIEGADGFSNVVFSYIEEQKIDKIEEEALIRNIKDSFEKYIRLNNKVSPQLSLSLITMDNLNEITDFIAANIFLKRKDRQKIVESINAKDRFLILSEILEKEMQILEIQKGIDDTVKKNIDKMQREYQLKEQLKVIKNELGFDDSDGNIAEELENKINLSHMPLEALEKAKKELNKLDKISMSSPESAVIVNYLELMCTIPWNDCTVDNFDLTNAQKILNKEHYGMDKIKERIIEFLAVKKIKKNMEGSVLCFVGPPGVGKTSIAKSIAKAVGRKFIRMSLGGVRDEAEIRGHRKTYVGAMPGKIMSLITRTNSNNPVFLLDEIDKMACDYNSSAVSAMLEVLDYEQNNKFFDNYLDCTFDLSKVLFIATANSIDSIPEPLLDRMELVFLSGYVAEEKENIATNYLIPKQLKKHGIDSDSVIFDKEALSSIIENYTREAGVRELQRKIGAICRKLAVKVAQTHKKNTVVISKKDIKKYLGIKQYETLSASKKNEVGLVKGLAWTQFGGDTIDIEVIVLKGSGKLELTGNLGHIMRESAYTAISFIRSIWEELNIEERFHEMYDIHVHVPEGAVPKDGPSAGITMATAIISGLKNTPVRKDIAMTGEITLRGRVLPIGGLKEKSLAALRTGILNVICPIGNKKDIEEIPKFIREKINYIFVSNLKEVIEIALAEK